ncbi:uncharacterized protein KY384_000134 [Bacidia gigantensis]|uniref:uncharacterized protein n=1 Tax=Bacidia gigantensis TaxID=2732470 RepID=UPI001D05AEC0|nr:uncharacterized protein KY384_000134 [Bacidia gigantensis]KAG8526141.1 hypothetical protein KY384_000134 [Bacidia gigantensis]
MSGAEAIAVLGVVSSIVAIVDAAQKIYSTAKESHGLPEAFREVASRLPIVENILSSVKENIGSDEVDEDSCRGVRDVAKVCEEKAERLRNLFQKAIPREGTPDLKRYYMAVKAYGKGNEVETLMKGILEDTQLLVCERGIQTATLSQQKAIAEAIQQISPTPPSVPDSLFEERGFVNINRPKEDVPAACMNALFLTDPQYDRDQLVREKGKRVKGTCEWIKSHNLYASWLRTSSQLLWLSGGPGKGKTMLSIYLAEELERKAESLDNSMFLQYFCDNKDEKRRTAVTVLRGLIFQLLKSNSKLFKYILPSYETQRESLFANPAFDSLWRIFKNMISDPVIGSTYCILDGLDECDVTSVEALLRSFVTLCSEMIDDQPIFNFKFFLVSRDLPGIIPEILSERPRISLDPDAEKEVAGDIEQFIEAKINELARLKRYSETLTTYVKKVFRNRAQGTFLWVGIVARELMRYRASEVEAALNQIPSKLDELYARILLQTENSRRDMVAEMLRWVVMAVRPLTMYELMAAIDYPTKPSAYVDRDDFIKDQISYCGYFLTIEGEKVGLIHQSAKDYLLREACDANPELEFFRVKKEAANVEVARRYFHYPQEGALAEGPISLYNDMDKDRRKEFPFLSYAVCHYPDHARFLSSSESIFDMSLPFYQKRSPMREAWARTYDPPAFSFFDMPLESCTVLHFASWCGITPLVQRLLYPKSLAEKLKRLYLDKKDGQGRTALGLAIRGGHQDIIRLLLEKGADINIINNDGGVESTALEMSAWTGNKESMQCILEKARYFKKDTKNEALLLAASWVGSEAMVLLLLKHGANIDFKDYIGETALYRAALSGSNSVVRVLIQNGADVNAKNKWGETALHKAAAKGYTNMISALLEGGCDINAKDKWGQTALHEAACGGTDETRIRLLLEGGCDINAKDKKGKTALHIAALGVNGYLDIEVEDSSPRIFIGFLPLSEYIK